MRKTVLIIANVATRTGAPILLLDVLSWMKKESTFNFVIIFEHGGELINEFRKLAKVYIWNSVPFSDIQNSNIWLISLIKKFIKRLFRVCFWWLLLFVIRLRYDIKLIFSNSSVNGYLLKKITKVFKRKKVMTYVHEGKYLIESHNRDSWVTYNLRNSDLLIAVSAYVKELLINQYDIQCPIIVIPGAINPRRLLVSKQINPAVEFGFEENSQILLSCGSLEWHKGIDIFMHLAKKLSFIDKKIKLIWLGGNSTDDTYFRLLSEIEKLNLCDTVKIIPSKLNAFDYFAMADIFLMLSRDESFSLVTVEAGFAKKPLLCFESSGGPTEIVDNDPRFLIPYLDIDFLSRRICDLLGDPDTMKSMGQYLYNRTVDNFLIDTTAPKILNEFNKTIG